MITVKNNSNEYIRFTPKTILPIFAMKGRELLRFLFETIESLFATTDLPDFVLIESSLIELIDIL